jgi:predicted MPP superfamily phosphohydrolase
VLLRQLIKRGFAGLIILFIILIMYIIWDNNRITVVEQEIGINSLPEEFEGFKILQVTDLHEKEFGYKQKRLIDAINAIDYDAIVFTGDVLDGTRNKNFNSFYTLIEGIQNKENALFVPGNTDPGLYNNHSKNPNEKVSFYKGMEKRGVKLLESIYTVKRSSSAIRFAYFEWTIHDYKKEIEIINRRDIPEDTPLKPFFDHQEKIVEELAELDKMNDSDVLVALNHYPVVDARIDHLIENPDFVFRNYDLIMAGHYHGGQIRLPFVGALFVPEAWYDSGFFPPQDRVKGLWEYMETKQYVSTGLGSSDAISFLKFRLFTPPELNVLTLKQENNDE